MAKTGKKRIDRFGGISLKLPLSKDEDKRWCVMVELANAMLDERGLEERDRRVIRAAKVRARFNGRVPADVDAVKRGLLEYMRMVDEDSGDGIRKALESVGASRGDLLTAMSLDADVQTVMDFLEERRRSLIRLTGGDMLSAAQRAQMRLLTEDECGLSTKMAMFTLEHLEPKTYGESESARGSDEGSAKTVYNISGVSINMLPGGAPPGGVVIDASEIIPSLEVKDGERT